MRNWSWQVWYSMHYWSWQLKWPYFLKLEFSTNTYLLHKYMYIGCSRSLGARWVNNLTKQNQKSLIKVGVSWFIALCWIESLPDHSRQNQLDLPTWPNYLTYLPDLPTWPTNLTYLILTYLPSHKKTFCTIHSITRRQFHNSCDLKKNSLLQQKNLNWTTETHFYCF